jgi:hypothetical protein
MAVSKKDIARVKKELNAIKVVFDLGVFVMEGDQFYNLQEYSNKNIELLLHTKVISIFYDLFRDFDFCALLSYNCSYLPESFIRKYKDELDWYYISTFGSLSASFIFEMKDYIDFDILMENENISEETKSEIKTLKEII